MSLADIETPPPPPYPAGNPRFSVGASVQVRHGIAPGHIRTPWYLRGKLGRIERICGAFGNPEELAYNRHDTPPIPLYRVRFTMAEIWGDDHPTPSDTIDAEIFEHWLEDV